MKLTGKQRKQNRKKQRRYYGKSMVETLGGIFKSVYCRSYNSKNLRRKERRYGKYGPKAHHEREFSGFRKTLEGGSF